MKIALFPGTFDPFTLGHYSIVERALPLFDRIVVAVGVNNQKRTLFSEEERLDCIRSLYCGNDRVEVIAYSGLTVDTARSCGAQFIVRGVRMIQDFEYEKNLAVVNRELSGIETVFLYTLPELGHVSSSIVRELISYGKDVTDLLPRGMVLPKR